MQGKKQEAPPMIWESTDPIRTPPSPHCMHFSLHGFSKCDPASTYKPGSVHVIRHVGGGPGVELKVSKILSCSSQKRSREYSALVSLDTPLHPDDAAVMFPGFYVDDVDPKSNGATQLVCNIMINSSWKGNFDRDIIDKISLFFNINKLVRRKLEVQESAILSLLQKHGREVVLHGQNVMNEFKRSILSSIKRDPVRACSDLRILPQYVNAKGIGFFIMEKMSS